MSTNRRVELPGKTVWTKGSTTTPLFHPATGALRSAGVRYLRWTRWEIRGDTGDVEVSGAFQVAGDDDEALWASATSQPVGSYSSGDGVVTNTSFTDASATLTGRLVRFGWLVRNRREGSRSQVGAWCRRTAHCRWRSDECPGTR